MVGQAENSPGPYTHPAFGRALWSVKFYSSAVEKTFGYKQIKQGKHKSNVCKEFVRNGQLNFKLHILAGFVVHVFQGCRNQGNVAKLKSFTFLLLCCCNAVQLSGIITARPKTSARFCLLLTSAETSFCPCSNFVFIPAKLFSCFPQSSMEPESRKILKFFYFGIHCL